jgi:alpha,alpha-trehalase
MDTTTINAVRTYIRNAWPKTFRNPPEVKPGALQLTPARFVVPCADEGIFQQMYYWDVWFTAEGLIEDGHVNMARSSAECFMHVVEHLGFIPNVLIEGIHRTQLPTAARLYRLVFQKTGDRIWLMRAARAVETELEFWYTFRSSPDGLNRAGHHSTPSGVANFYWSMRERIRNLPHAPGERLNALAHLMAECEVWDFTPRFAGRCMDFSPIDLNSELVEVEDILAWMLDELQDPRASYWRQRAAVRRTTIERLMWDDQLGWYQDWDHVRKCRGSVPSAAGLWALASGVASPERAERVRANLGLVERACGITTCVPGPRPPGQVYQWDDPNAWPPLQWIAVLGLDRYGFRTDAERIASKYIDSVTSTFAHSGKLWEKYNAYTGGLEVADEYPMPPLMDWTAGVYIACCKRLGV